MGTWEVVKSSKESFVLKLFGQWDSNSLTNLEL